MMTSRYSLHNKKGKTICAECYLEVRTFKNGKAWVKDTSGAEHSSEYTSDGYSVGNPKDYALWGLINKKGQWVVKPSYNVLDTFIDGKAIITKYSYKYYYTSLSSDFTERVDSFKGIENDYNYRHVRFFDLNPNNGMVAESGKEIIPIKYPELYRYINGYALASLGIRPKMYDPNNLQKISYSNTSNDTHTRYILFDEKGNIYKRLYHQEIVPQYITTSSENYFNSPEFSENAFIYKKPPLFYSYMDVHDNVEYYGLLDSKGNEFIPPYVFTNQRENVTFVLDDINDPYVGHDTAIITYSRPPFYYDSLSGQLFFKFVNGKTNSSLVADDKGTILYKSNNEFFLNSFPSNSFRYINFAHANGTYIINFSCPIGENYDTVKKYFDQFKPFPNMEIEAFQGNPNDTTSSKIGHKLYITHRDSLYGLINKSLKEIIPIKYAAVYEDGSGELFPSGARFDYAPPNILYINQTGQYIYSGKNITTSRMEAFIISPDGEIVTNIIDCTDIVWEPQKLMYSITLLGGVNKLCDTKGNIK